MKVLALVLTLCMVATSQRAQADLGTKDPGLLNLKGTIYALPDGTNKMPADIEKQKPEGVIYTSSLDVPARPFEDGFPGVTNRFEWFGIIYTGKFQIAKAGSFAFRTRSDDGVILWIDGKQVLEHDSIHGPDDATGSISLKAGMHDIKVWYFQGPAYTIALQLFVTPPGQEERIFDLKDFSADLTKTLQELGGEATEQGIRVRLSADVLFDRDKAVLKPAAKKAIAKLAVVLKSYPSASVMVNGHTSSEGAAEHNQKLSERRAGAVKAALAKSVPKTVTLTATGFGPGQPIADNSQEQTRKLNRRVEIIVRP